MASAMAVMVVPAWKLNTWAALSAAELEHAVGRQAGIHAAGSRRP